MFFLIATTFILLPFSELLRFEVVETIRLRFLDLLAIAFLFLHLVKKHFKLTLDIPLQFFIFTLGLSFISNLSSFNFPSLLYLLRTLVYLQIPSILSSLKLNQRQKQTINILFLLNLAILLLTGFIQYFFYPNLRNLIYLGYDPHLYRLFGLFLDPNLFGIVLVWFCFWILKNYQKQHLQLLLLPPTITAILLTYSRITWLVLITAATYAVFKRKSYLKYLFLLLLLFLFSLPSLPKKFGEGTKIFRSSTIISKYHAWQQGLKLVVTKPLLGIGFNNLPLYKLAKTTKDNAIFALDSSLLTLVVTTGILGVFTYLYFFWSLFTKKSFFQQLFALTFFIHALSTNSFLTPTIFVYFALFWQLTNQRKST